MTDEQKMLQRMGAMLLAHVHGDDFRPAAGKGSQWVHSPDCLGNRCSCGALYIAYSVGLDGDITVTEVRNNGKLRVRLGERG